LHGIHELACDDILGTIITDATIILDIIAVINPFTFEPTIINLADGRHMTLCHYVPVFSANTRCG
jgi:hypothetical protein